MKHLLLCYWWFLVLALLPSQSQAQSSGVPTAALTCSPAASTLRVGCPYRFTVALTANSCYYASSYAWDACPAGATVTAGGRASDNFIELTFSTASSGPSQTFGANAYLYCSSPSGGSSATVRASTYIRADYVDVTATAFTSQNPVCQYTPFTLTLRSAQYVTSCVWQQKSFASPNSTWTDIQNSATSDATNGFAYTVSGLYYGSIYRARLTGCTNNPYVPTYYSSEIQVNLMDYANAGGVAVGTQDVVTGANQGSVFITGNTGVLNYWQYSQDNGANWTTVNQVTEELKFENLIATTLYRAVSTLCGNTYFSTSCTVRVYNPIDDISWTETKAFDLSGTTLIGDTRTYFDKSAKPLQNQTKSLSTGKILAMQPLYGKYGQVVGSTLTAPIAPVDFAYQPTFVTPASATSAPYDYTRFDDGTKINAPEAVSSATQNTLGWYYSANNTIEKYTPITSFPYSRTDAMPDGSTGVSRVAGPNPYLQLGGTTADGKTHEAVQGNFSVRTELDTYATVRSSLFPMSAVGGQVTTLKQTAVQQLSTDADGNTTLVFSDKEGHPVMSARPATTAVVAGQPDAWMTAVNTVEVGWPYSVQLPANTTLGLSVAAAFACTADIMVFDNQGTWLATGSPDAIAANSAMSGNVGNYLFFSTSAFTIAAAPTGGGTPTPYTSQQREAYPFFNFYIVGDGSTTITSKSGLPASAYTLINTVTGQPVPFSNGTALPAGCYQLRIERGAVNLTYSNRYKDVSYNFYNQKGQLIESIAPKGVLQVLQNVRATGAPLASSGQMGYWRFTEGTGTTVADASGQGLTGTLQGAGAWGPSYTPSQQAALLRGYVDIGDQAAVRMGSALTLEAWVKPNLAGGSPQVIIGKEKEYLLAVFNDGTIQCAFMNDPGLWSWMPTGITLADNTWANVAVTYNNGIINSYLNGKLTTTQSKGSGSIQYNGGRLCLGAVQGGGAYFAGLLDEVKVWNVARTPTDIASSYQASLTGSIPFSTTFEYDQQGRQTAQNETDGGRTEFTYRADGKLRFSQNAKQRVNGFFSYLNYDTIGRVLEAGENQGGNVLFANCKANLTILEYIPIYGAYDDGGMGCQNRKDVVRTYYDQTTSFALPSGYTPAFLSGRVAATQKASLFIPCAVFAETSRTIYSYDEQGRTQWQVQQVIASNQPARTIDYTYDAAGNTATVCYQKNTSAERLTHYYTYDADNRLTLVQTDQLNPANSVLAARTEHARYTYYTHGPLKRVVYGGNLQGVDYTYTAAGQLKAINDGDIQRDPGQDGLGSSTTQYADFFGTSLHYYQNDYAAAAVTSLTTSMSSGSVDYVQHYNGLVSGMSWQTPGSPLNAYGYNYDYKGQLLKATYGRMYNYTTNRYAFIADPNRYQEGNLDYDANGNIGHLQRTDGMGAATLAGAYDYVPGTNQLNKVLNAGSQAVSYSYDAIGQMTKQQESDPTKTKYLDYDASGKVTAIYADANQNPIAKYTYDEFGKRLTQQVYPNPLEQTSYTTTTFVRDAAGHELASYVAVTTANSTAPTLLYEQPIYGATRLGIYRQARDQTPAEQLYELNDQLGNTRIVFRRPTTVTYALSMENAQVNYEKQDFPGPTATTYDNVRSSNYNHSSDNPGWSIRLNGSGTSVGPTKTIAAQRGDKFHLTVYGLYNNTGSGYNITVPMPSANKSATGLPGVFLSTAPRTALPVEGTQPASRGLQQVLSQVSLGISIPLLAKAQYLGSARTAATTAGTLATNGNGPPPAAALQYTIYRASDHSLVGGSNGSGRVYLQANGAVDWQFLALDLTIMQDYPVEVEISTVNSDGSIAAYFDDLMVQYTPGPVIEENHYYAYGQRNDGLSWRRTDKRLYGRGYQGQNTTQDAESGYTAFDLRMYDARYGRWLMVDPMRQFASGYVAMGNNPISGIDPDGGSVLDIIITGANGNKITLAAPGDNIYINTDAKFNKNYNFTFNDAETDYRNFAWQITHYSNVDNFISSQDLNKFFMDIDVNSAMDFAGLAEASWFPDYLTAISGGYRGNRLDFSSADGYLARTANNHGYDQSTWSLLINNQIEGPGPFYRSGSVIYNYFDAGNFLTGQSFKRLSIPLDMSLHGADVYARTIGGFEWKTFFQGDSKADQRAISNGWNLEIRPGYGK